MDRSNTCSRPSYSRHGLPEPARTDARPDVRPDENVRHKNLLTANKIAFLTIGVLEAVWAPLVPFVKVAFGLDEGQMGLLMLCSGLGSVCALPVAGALTMRFGARRTVCVSGAVMAAALLMIGMMVDMWFTACMLMIFGACTIIIDVAANINGVAVENRTGRHLMSGFHGGYSLGTLIGAGAMSVLFTCGAVPLHAVLACLAVTLATLLWGARNLLSRGDLKEVSSAGTTSEKRSSGIPPMVLVVGLLCFVMYASEGAVMGWAAIFASEVRGVDMADAGFFYTAFAVTMTAMRLSGDRIVDGLGRRRVVTLGALCVGAGFLLVITVPHVAGTVVGFAVVGLGAANIVPQLISFGGSIKGMAVQNIISIINALGYSGVLIGPVLIGFVAKRFGLQTSFAGLALLALVVAAVASAILAPRRPSAGR